MTEQLAIVPAEPRPLTERQVRALEHVQSAGADGLSGVDLGRVMGASEMFAKSTGLGLLRALKKKGYVRQMRGGLWRAVDLHDQPSDGRFHPAMSDEIPY